MQNENSQLRKELQRILIVEAEDKKPMKDTEKKQNGDAFTSRKVIHSIFYISTCWIHLIFH